VALAGATALGSAQSTLARRIDGPTDAPIHAPVIPKVTPQAQGHARRVTVRAPTLVERVQTALRKADAGAPVPFPLANLTDDYWYTRYCHALGGDSHVSFCPHGAPVRRPLVVAYGDSHMGQWLPALDLLGRRHGFQVLPLLKDRCSPFDVPMTDGSTAEYTSCYTFRRWAVDQIRRLHPDAVLISSRTAVDRVIAPDATTTWDTGARSTLAAVSDLAPSVSVIGDVPELGQEPADCLTTPGSDLGDCVAHQSQALARSEAMLRRVAADLRLRYVNTRALLCSAGRCPVVVDQTVTYGDSGHLSVTWTRLAAGDLWRLWHPALPATKGLHGDPAVAQGPRTGHGAAHGRDGAVPSHRSIAGSF
jgi:hypothetical protein